MLHAKHSNVRRGREWNAGRKFLHLRSDFRSVNLTAIAVIPQNIFAASTPGKRDIQGNFAGQVSAQAFFFQHLPSWDSERSTPSRTVKNAVNRCNDVLLAQVCQSPLSLPSRIVGLICVQLHPTSTPTSSAIPFADPPDHLPPLDLFP
jgi:hypothetical protein